ncbi:extracellular solute-binding protein [Paenibacillus sp. SYP-B3998]|uniref:Extracellular solute-binding protein n=1 Tax=Paenibacillus sp. SYP-B3998 TaxID=2678564 RepID=A0A6G4A3Y3_9BACL|nr:extracellular solute-binding protein [Paenibacillus sp. SYP-B3998]NEW09040.1 extracellular solute-binding protein [Paenibacillus sp. SYP-B3998]
MKKIMFILISCMMMFAVTACQSSNSGGGTSEVNGGTAQPVNENKIEKEQTNNANLTTETPQSKGGKKTIVFSTHYEYDSLNEAKKKYEAAHPNIEIKLNYIPSVDGEKGKEYSDNFIKKTNTELLSGNGPDMVIMDHLPMGNYVNKKILANLSEMMEKDPTFKKDQYFNNILEGSKLNGSIYGLPLRFFVYGLAGDEEAIAKTGIKFDDQNWSWSQFNELAKGLVKKGDRQSALFGNREDFLNEMVQDNTAMFVDQANRKANFQSEPFIQLLNQVKKMFDDKVVTERPTKVYFVPAQINSPADYILSLREYFDKPKLYTKPNVGGQKVGNYYRAYNTIGINEKSAVKKEAWEFLKFLLSEDLRPAANKTGFPLNKAEYDRQVKQLIKDGSVKAHEEGPLKGKTIKVTEADIQGLDKYISGAIYPVEFKPTKIQEIISNESKAFFSGQKSAEDVAKLIQNRVTTYLNE